MICYFLFRVMANPEKPPAIDWSYYQNRVAVPGLVESFKKQYEALQVPYPVDKVTAQVDAQEKEAVSLDNFY
jgi:F-type H+-transporting ATPase subunit d